MHRTWRALELLAAKTRIEKALSAGGFHMDHDSKEAINRALGTFVENVNLDIEIMEAQIIDAHLEPRKKAA